MIFKLEYKIKTLKNSKDLCLLEFIEKYPRHQRVIIYDKLIEIIEKEKNNYMMFLAN